MEYISRSAVLFFSVFIAVMFVTDLICNDESEINEIEKCKQTQHCHVMETGFTSNIKMSNSKGLFTTFCHHGSRLKTFGILSSAGIVVFKNTGYFKVRNMDVYHGNSIAEVEQNVKSSYRIPSFSLGAKADIEYHSMEVVGVSCVLIDADGDFSLKYAFNVLDFWKLVMLAAGMILFVTSKPLSDTKLMHYAIAAVLFMVGWLHIVVYLCVDRLKRFGTHEQHIKNRTHIFGFCVATFLYLLYFLLAFLTGYWRFIVLQSFISGVLGMAYIYRYHTVSDKRTIDILTWGLQIIGIILVWNAIAITAAGITLCVLVVTFYYWDIVGYSGLLDKGKSNAAKSKAPPILQSKRILPTTDQETNVPSKAITKPDVVHGQLKELGIFLHRPLVDDRILVFVLDYCNMVLQHHGNSRRRVECKAELLAMIEHLKRLLHLATLCHWQTVVSIHDDFMFEIENGTKVWGDGTADIESKYFN